MAGLEVNDDTHGFLHTGEGDHLDDLGRLASFLPVLPIEILGGLKQGGLGLGSAERELLCLRVDILEGSGVDHDRLANQAPELRKGSSRRHSAGREDVCVFLVDLGLVDVGYILFLGGFLLLIRRFHVGLVLPEVTNKPGSDANRPATAPMTFWVSVPVISVQMMGA